MGRGFDEELHSGMGEATGERGSLRPLCSPLGGLGPVADAKSETRAAQAFPWGGPAEEFRGQKRKLPFTPASAATSWAGRCPPQHVCASGFSPAPQPQTGRAPAGTHTPGTAAGTQQGR